MSLRVDVVTWAPGGNLPPLLAASALLADRGHEVRVLGSAATRPAAERAGLATVAYQRAGDPDTGIAFEHQAQALLATMAGTKIACDVHHVLRESRPDLAVIDCMLPAAIAAAAAAGTPATSLVHFLYGPARAALIGGHAFAIDTARLAATRRALGLADADALAAWESPRLLLVTAPRWLDVDAAFPAHVVHAGPLGVRHGPAPAGARRRVLLSFSTTVMDGQPDAIRRACAAVGATGAPATLTLGPAVDGTAIELPGNVEAVAFADHDGLMPDCAAVITHGGLGTTLRALAHAVPLLLLPLGRDQEFNAQRVVALGAGIRLAHDSDPGALQAALERLLGEPGYAAAAARAAARIAAAEPDRAAARALESCARP